MISIIGAGPVGCYTAYLLAKNNYEVNVFEDHSEIGKPVQCTGIVTSAIEDIIPLNKKFITNKIEEARVFSKNKNIELSLKNPNFVLDRARFDRHISLMARKAGANILLNHKFIDFKNPYIIMEDKKSYKTDILIGADGPSSRVAKSAGLYGKREFVIGLQARVNSRFTKKLVEFYLDKDYFGWAVPESSDIGRIGIAAKGNAKACFKDFLKRFGRKYKTIEYQSGLIPVYSPLVKTQIDSVYLVGDAAAMVKPTTYGGIVQGLMASEELVKSIKENKDYPALWKKRIGKELGYGLLIRKVMNNFSNEDYDELLELVNSGGIKRIISGVDRDFPSQILFKLAIKQPKLLKFIKNIY